MISCFLDSRLDINIPIGTSNQSRSINEWLEKDLGVTLFSDIGKISECRLSIVRIDDSSEPLRRCAILYHSISNRTLCIIGFLQDKKSLPFRNHISEMDNLICIDKEDELRKTLGLAMALIREGKNDEYIKRTIKKERKIRKKGFFDNFKNSVDSISDL